MTLYQYRWLYAVALSAAIILTGMYFTVIPAISQIIEFSSIENKLLEQLTVIKRAAEKIPGTSYAMSINNFQQQHDQMELLADLLNLVHLHGLMVQTANFLPARKFYQQEVVIIKLVIQGDFQQFYAFVSTLVKQNNMNIILDFSYKPSMNNQLLFTMEIGVSNMTRQHSLSNLAFHNPHLSNPFCSLLNNSEMAYDRLIDWQNIPLGQLKMLGFFQQGQRIQALLGLPNNTIFAIKPGMIIGKEHALVAAIYPNQLLLRLPAGKQMKILLE